MVCNRHIPTLRNDLLDTTLSAVREERQRDPGTSPLAAHYEYNPYGNLINSSGAYRDANPFRFSTKWFDDETHLGYWGYRCYSPRLGRWLSRDPIGEEGGLNLCAFVQNLPANHVDALGFQALPPDSWYPAPTKTTELWRVEDCSATQKETANKARRSACDCIDKAARIISDDTLWQRALRKCPNYEPYLYWTLAGAGLDPKTKAQLDAKLSQFKSSLAGMQECCKYGFGLECECSCASEKGDESNGYVVSFWGYAFGDVHLCPNFFTDKRDHSTLERSQRATIIHELSHLCGDVHSDDGAFPTNAHMVRKAVQTMCDTYDQCTSE